jgi:hypothetical protein
MSQAVWDGRVVRAASNSQVLVQFDMGTSQFCQEIPRDWIEQDVDLMEALQKIGLFDDAQHYWTMILSPSEQHVVKSLGSCQRTAIDHVRTLAAHSHSQALPTLMERARSIGINEEHLWAMLTWIRDCASIIIHVRLDSVGQFLESDTHYRNQFETKTSNGMLNTDTRTQWESDLFGGSYGNSAPVDRPKYGVLDVMNDHRGVVCAYHYGDSYLVLKNVRLRCSFAPEDSGGISGSRLAVLDQYAHVLLEYEDNELLEVARIANAPEGSKERIGNSLLLSEYKEAQIHGEIDLKKHVKRLVVNERHHTADADFGEARVRALCHKHGWEVSWMDNERKRRISEERSRVDPIGFKVNWSNGDVIACAEVPDVLPGEKPPPSEHGRLRPALSPNNSSSGASTAARTSSSSPRRRPLSDLSGRALKNGLGSLSQVERETLFAEWAAAISKE